MSFAAMQAAIMSGAEIAPDELARMSRTESGEQVAVMEWASLQSGRWPDIDLLHHVPNGGARNIKVAKKLKREGVKKGVLDLSLPVPRMPFHGLYVEMKADGGRVSKEQAAMIERLRKLGYCVEVCFGADAAIAAIEKYMCLPEWKSHE